MNTLVTLFSVAVFWLGFPAFIAGETEPSGVDSSGTSFNRTSGPMGNQIVATFKVSVFGLDSMITWVHAEKQCNNSGGHLISITNDNENALIYSMMSASVTDCWIGLFNIGGLDSSSNSNTNSWRWIDETHFSYRSWDTGHGQPDNWKGHESCGEIYGHSTGENYRSLWNDVDCTNRFNCFICGNVIAIEPVTGTTTIIPTTSTTTTTLPTTSTSTVTVTSSTTSKITSTSAASNLLPTGGDIALIVLASIFFLTTVVLTVPLLKNCSKNQLHCPDRICCRSKKENTVDTVSNDVHETNLDEPEGNNNAMYYDIECEAVEPQYSIIMKPVKNQDQRKPDANQIIDERFASNEMYS